MKPGVLYRYRVGEQVHEIWLANVREAVAFAQRRLAATARGPAVEVPVDIVDEATGTRLLNHTEITGWGD